MKYKNIFLNEKKLFLNEIVKNLMVGPGLEPGTNIVVYCSNAELQALKKD